MRILFIAYYFKPFQGVGAKRISYWFENISKHQIKADVITAIEGEEDSQVHLVKDNNNRSLFTFLIRDKGLSWKKDLLDYFKKNAESFDYDIVLISGGPFMHMGIGKYLKKRFNCKVVLDFRDPFANNPRFGNSLIKKSIKGYFEKRFVKNADKTIVVNEVCRDLLYNKSSEIIDNGFDEIITSQITPQRIDDQICRLITIGNVYEVDLEPLSEFLSFNKNYKLNYIGSSDRLDHIENVKNLGFKDYKYMMAEVANSDICILLTSGEPFESTTKIFDYLAFNKKLLIITEGEKKTGSIHTILDDYPNVCWANNDLADINKAILELSDSEVINYDINKYSRERSLEKLIKLFNTL